MNTRKETDTKVKDVARKLAYAGIVAIYGGKKGHGFWLAKPKYDRFLALRFFHDPIKTDIIDMVETLTNDGAKTGNPNFWAFDDARALADQKLSDIHAFVYPRMDYTRAVNGGWIETDMKMYDQALEAVPPLLHKNGAFLVGECNDYEPGKGNIYAAFVELAGRFFAAYKPGRSFNPVVYRQEIKAQFGIED